MGGKIKRGRKKRRTKKKKRKRNNRGKENIRTRKGRGTLASNTWYRKELRAMHKKEHPPTHPSTSRGSRSNDHLI